MLNPTEDTYSELKRAFMHFNERLFDGQLQEPLFTLQREKRFYGFCSKQRFVSRSNGDMVDEIAMNPAYFAVRPIQATLSTLAHEMCHQWQFHFGKPGRRGYHNKEWGHKMKSIGLHPSATGEPGGPETGESMTHYIIDSGPFDLACQQLLTEEFTFSWLDRFPVRPPVRVVQPMALGISGEDEDLDDDDNAGTPATPIEIDLPPGIEIQPENRSNRVKYRCPTCFVQVWGKPNINVGCMAHEKPEYMQPIET